MLEQRKRVTVKHEGTARTKLYRLTAIMHSPFPCTVWGKEVEKGA